MPLNDRLQFLFPLRCLIAVFAVCAMSMAAELPRKDLEKLADDAFKAREEAQKNILAWAKEHPEKAPRMLFEYHRQTKDPEAQFRCMRILESLAREGYAKHGKGFIGIQMRDEMALMPGGEKHQAAIRITSILPGLAAEKAGLKVGDLVVGINGKGWPSPATDAMREQVMDMKPTTKITVQVLRGEKVEDVDVVLVKRPLTADRPMTQRMAEEAERREWEQYFKEWKERHDPEA